MSLATDVQYMIEGREDKETVWYHAADEIPRQVMVLINRDPVLSESVDVVEIGTLRREVDVVNDPVLGVARPKVNKDRIHMKAHVCDEQDSIFRVESIVYQDPGKYRLRVVL